MKVCNDINDSGGYICMCLLLYVNNAESTICYLLSPLTSTGVADGIV